MVEFKEEILYDFVDLMLVSASRLSGAIGALC